MNIEHTLYGVSDLESASVSYFDQKYEPAQEKMR